LAKYYRPEIQAQRSEILSHFYGFSDAPHAVYAVVEWFAQKRTVIYVGETGRPLKRFEQHLKVAYGGREDTSRLGQRERGIIARGGTIEFHYLELCYDRVTTLAREASWVRALRSEGCNLANLWPEHLADSKVTKVPMKRLMYLSLEEAQHVKTDLRFKCIQCAVDLSVSTDALAKLKIRNPTLVKFKKSLICDGCKKPYILKIDLPEAVDHYRLIDANSVDAKRFIPRYSPNRVFGFKAGRFPRLSPGYSPNRIFGFEAGRFRCLSPLVLRVGGNVDGDDHGRPHLGSAI
jgi:hypothetical protein